MHQKWYYEAEITQLPAQRAGAHFHVRVGWAHTSLFHSRPSSNSFLTTSGGIGDDLYSVAYDGEFFWFGGESFKTAATGSPSKKKLRRQVGMVVSPTHSSAGSSFSVSSLGAISVGDVIGCYLDLGAQEVWFTKNGVPVPGCLRFCHLDDMVTPAISVSSGARYMYMYIYKYMTLCS